jgi:hypothetical protein
MSRSTLSADRCARAASAHAWRRARWTRVAAALLFVAAGGAQACGVCVEDKVAATYDHAVVMRAAKDHRVVVFAALDGHVDGRRAAAAARAAAARAHGVDAASVRTADNPAAISFVVDPARQAPRAALQAVEKGAGVPGLRLTLLRIVD